ncbi:MAG: DUF4351 domain-containing protein [Chroococcidiopsidaceae cyanobacterium CP_BM_RX_35]|nr:DUF4351 domain-containing protein [Chroococcidiopsidaceae cyanobacterium CP_BM_RX_35]
MVQGSNPWSPITSTRTGSLRGAFVKLGLTQLQLQQLRVEQLEELGEVLLDFSSVPGLMDWLEEHEP